MDCFHLQVWLPRERSKFPDEPTESIVTKVSVFFNLRICGCELKDNYCVSFTQLFKKKKYRYIGILVILSPIFGFLSLVRVTQFSQFEKGILCP